MVGIYRCKEYNEEVITGLINGIFKKHGFDKMIKEGMNVVLKPNMLALRDEKTATTTNKVFLKCVAKKVLELGAKCTVCDSPAGNYSEEIMKKMYIGLGYDTLEDMGVILNYDTSFKRENIHGKIIQNIDIITPILDADLVINLPKLKTHQMMNLTCAVKNLFGIIPGKVKSEIHSIYNDYTDFANVLIDISSSVKNQITIVDAVYSMEGNGPNQGKPRYTGLVFATDNQFELDYVAMKIINLQLRHAYTVKESIKRKLFDEKNIEIIGENLSSCIIKDFKKPDILRKSIFKNIIFFSKLVKPYPIFDHEKCIKCMKCVTRCPENVLELKNGKIILKSKKNCIRCFCCTEHCPAEAVSIKHQFIFSDIKKLVKHNDKTMGLLYENTEDSIKKEKQ
jgi:uncharacterized protein (DUF362 family)/Pyruvate/2-oxoacid:ferredoxin oxidoreductase delta subunit